MQAWELAVKQAQEAKQAAPAPAPAPSDPAPVPSTPSAPEAAWQRAVRQGEREKALAAAPPIPEVITRQPTVMERAKSWIMSPAEFPDAKEIPAVMINAEGKPVGIADNLSAASYNPYAMADIYESAFPGTEVLFDRYMNPYVEFSKTGEKRYLNKPGPSRGDLSQMLASGSLYAIGGALGGKVGQKALGGAGRVLGVGMGAGAASFGEDMAAIRLGSEQGLDPAKAATAGMLGLTGEAGSMLLSRFVGALARSRFVQNGKLTSAGRVKVARWGADPDEIDDLFSARAKVAAAGSEDPAASVRQMQAESLDPPVPMTKAQAQGKGMGSAKAWEIEEEFRKGIHGEKAQNVMLAQQSKAGKALEQNVENVRARAMGVKGVMINRPGEGAGQVADDIKSAFSAHKAKVTAAYGRAKEGVLSFDQRIITDAADDISNYLRVEEGVDFVNDKVPAKWLRQLRETTTTEAWRKQITRDIQNLGPTEPATARLLRIMRDRVDDAIDDAVTRGLASGDPGVIDAFKEGRALRYQQSQLFGSTRAKSSQDAGLKVIQKIVEHDWTPEQSLDYMLGLGKIGAKKTAVQSVKAVKRIFGNDSPQVAMLRDELLLKLLANQPKSGYFSAAALRTSINDAFKNSYSLMDELVPGKEQDFLRRLAKTADDLVTPSGALNPSGSGWVVLRQLMGSQSGGGRLANMIIGRFAGPFSDAYRAQQARAATRWFPRSVPLIPVGAGGVVPGAFRKPDPLQLSTRPQSPGRPTVE